MRFRDGAHGRRERVAVAHVDRVRAPADLARDDRGRVGVAIEHRHRRALGGEPHGGGPSDPRRTTADDRDLPVELTHGRRR